MSEYDLVQKEINEMRTNQLKNRDKLSRGEFEYLIRETVDYVYKNNLKSLVLGISGGIDSALVAAIAHEACKELAIPLIGAWIEIESNKPDEKKRAKMVGEAFCSEFREFNFTDLYKEVWIDIAAKGDEALRMEENLARVDKGTLDRSKISLDTKIRQGNMKARLRMITLYDIAQANKGMVLSTDNFTEYLLGFWTLHGDVGDFGPIQELWKTEVYEIAEQASRTLLSRYEKGDKMMNALSECILAVPTDGLGVSESDLDQLGASCYQEVDEILQYVYNKDVEALPTFIRNHPVVQRHIKSEFKRLNPVTVRIRKELDAYKNHIKDAI